MVSGKKGDAFAFGAWAKADSLIENGINRKTNELSYGSEYNPTFSLTLKFFNGNTEVGIKYATYNSQLKDWQFISENAIAPDAYTHVEFVIMYFYNGNEANFSLPYIYKENYGQSYTHDKDGNVVNAEDYAKTQSTFAYKNNQLAKLTSPTGSRFMYTYDNDGKHNLDFAHSTEGQRYTFSYDDKGNPTKAVVQGD